MNYNFPKAAARSYMEEQLKTGEALLLLDALDETMIGETVEVAEASYRRTVEAIMRIATRYYQSPIVVTARKASYQQQTFLTGFTELEVLNFRSEEITRFVDQWFAYYPSPQKQINARDLNARLERNPRIQALAANPLLLALIVLVYEAQLDLPDRRAELYRQCVETLLTKWDASRDIRRRRQFKPEHKRQLLEEIAWHFHLQGQRYFPEHELLEVIAEFLPAIGLPSEQNDWILREIAAENGLLKEQARGWHGFLHMTLQEYFVAQYATEHHQLDTLLEYRGDPWWEEVILLYAGYTPDASPFLRKLLGQDKDTILLDDIFQTNLVLAGHCLAAHPTVRQALLREEVVSRLFSALKHPPYLLMSEHIADALSEIGGEKVDAHLLELLADPAVDPNVRVSIATALGALGDLSIAEGLHHLLNEPRYDLFVKVHIATTLDMLGDRSVIPGLQQILTNSQGDPALRIHIASYLNTQGERSAAPVLLRILSDSQTNPAVSESIATTIGALGDQSVIPELLRLLTAFQSEPNLQMHIVIALGSLGVHSVIPQLLQLLSNPQISLSAGLNIAATLRSLDERSVVPELLRLLSNPQIDPIVQTGIVQALGQLADDEATLHVLATLLPNSVIADEIYRALWHISRRIGARISMADGSSTKDFSFVRQGESDIHSQIKT